MWDERYNNADYAFGTEPNDFLVSAADILPKGKILCLGEGEGRNAVWLAERGFDVTAVDASRVGLDKALRLAEERGVTLKTVHADLDDYVIEPMAWDAVVSIFCHLPPPLRRRVHGDVVGGLKPGGAFLLEAYTPAQLSFGTGGPPTLELMMDLETLRRELEGLELTHAGELVRTIHEGEYHNGQGAVVQILGIKPGC
jgi:SAM-dependent methyltransferase